MLFSMQAMIGSIRLSAARIKTAMVVYGLCAAASVALAQDDGDPLSPAPDTVSVLPEFCASSGLSEQECLDILGQMDLVRYCRIKDVKPENCAAFIASYSLPGDCRSANLTTLGCIDFLGTRNRFYREQVKGLIAQCNGEDLSVCEVFQHENAELKARIAQLEAELSDARADLAETGSELAEIEGTNATLRTENTDLADRTETLQAQLALAETAREADRVDVADVCRAAALKLNAGAREALGAEAPELDEAACALNPIAEVTRFLGTVDLPAASLTASDLPAGPAPAPLPEPAPEPDPVPDPEPDPDAQTAQDCAPRPGDAELADYLGSEPAVFGVLAPVRFNRLVRELAQGTTARDAVNIVWPSTSDPEDFVLLEEAVQKLCSAFPATCTDEVEVTVCP